MKHKSTSDSPSADLDSACRKAALAYRRGTSAHFLRLQCRGGRTLLVTFEPHVMLSLHGALRLAQSIRAERAIYVGKAQAADREVIIGADLPRRSRLALDVQSLNEVPCPDDVIVSRVIEAFGMLLKVRSANRIPLE